MKETLIKRLGNLLTIKSIVTIILTFLIVYVVVSIVNGRIAEVPEFLKNIYITVIAFYFGTQVAKKA